MTTEVSASAFSAAAARAQDVFLQTLRFVLSVVTGVFMPHIMAGVGLFLVTGFAVYHAFVAPLGMPLLFEVSAALLIVTLYGAFAFVYSALTASVFAVWAASVRTEEFLEEVFSLVKARVESKVNGMEEGIAKEQAKVLLKNSVTEVFGLFKTYKLKSFPALVASVFLAAVTFVTKTVFIARLMQLSGTVVNVSAVFASRATLVGAVFLNLRLLSTVALWGLYAFGALLIGLNFVFVFMWK